MQDRVSPGTSNGVLGGEAGEDSSGKRKLATSCDKALSHNLPGAVDIVGAARSDVDNAHAPDRPASVRQIRSAYPSTARH